MQATSKPPRYSQRPFPPYRFMPGETPHPTRDPAGHSYAVQDETPSAFSAADWAGSESYLYGVDLFNHGYWWEAHEAWEACWMAAGRTSPTGLCLQGLIQVAAACLKRCQGKEAAARRLSTDGLARLRQYPDLDLGFDTMAFARAMEAYLAGRRTAPPQLRLPQLERA